MEQTIAFVLGVLSVLALAGVYGMFKTRVQIKDLYTEIEDLQNVINELEREIHRDNEMLDRRIDQEIDRFNKVSNTLHDHTSDEMNKLYAYIDSRTDKMADGISKHIADINTRFNDNTALVDKLVKTK
jgi:chromosome segregation ATPase